MRVMESKVGQREAIRAERLNEDKENRQFEVAVEAGLKVVEGSI